MLKIIILLAFSIIITDARKHHLEIRVRCYELMIENHKKNKIDFFFSFLPYSFPFTRKLERHSSIHFIKLIRIL